MTILCFMLRKKVQPLLERNRDMKYINTQSKNRAGQQFKPANCVNHAKKWF
jgi:hypothetical protein